VDWAQMLDNIVAQRGEPPPMVEALRLPGIEGWEPGRVWGTWAVDEVMFHAGGAVFGGYLAALADSYVGLAMTSALKPDEWFSTADLRVAFFRPVTKGSLQIAAEVLNRGRRMAHVECVFVNDDDKVVAKATATQVITPLSDPSA
jgi:uncharacterized protein (TIGR00369 family)